MTVWTPTICNCVHSFPPGRMSTPYWWRQCTLWPTHTWRKCTGNLWSAFCQVLLGKRYKRMPECSPSEVCCCRLCPVQCLCAAPSVNAWGLFSVVLLYVHQCNLLCLCHCGCLQQMLYELLSWATVYDASVCLQYLVIGHWNMILQNIYTYVWYMALFYNQKLLKCKATMLLDTFQCTGGNALIEMFIMALCVFYTFWSGY